MLCIIRSLCIRLQVRIILLYPLTVFQCTYSLSQSLIEIILSLFFLLQSLILLDSNGTYGIQFLNNFLAKTFYGLGYSLSINGISCYPFYTRKQVFILWNNLGIGTKPNIWLWIDPIHRCIDTTKISNIIIILLLILMFNILFFCWSFFQNIFNNFFIFFC